MNRRRLAAGLLVGVVLTTSPGFAAHVRQSPTRRMEDLEYQEDPNGSDWDDIRFTAREISHRIAHPETKDKLVFMGLAVGAIYLQQDKFELQSRVQMRRSETTDRISSSVRPLGEVAIPAAILTTYLAGRFTGSTKTRRTGLILAEAGLLSFGTTELMQFVLSEGRPREGGELTYFHSGGHGVSGHTSIVAAMSVPLDRMFFKFKESDSGLKRFGKWVGKTFAYGAPVAVAWSRMNDDKHFAWSVFLGLGIGFTAGEFVADAHDPEEGGVSKRKWDIVPISDGKDGFGLAMRLKY